MKKLLAIGVFLALAWPSQGICEPSKDPSIRATSQSIGDEDVEPKDPFMAEIFSVLPGVVFHGSGNLYAGDYEFGTKMLTMELFGAGLSLWGYDIIHSPNDWGPYFGDNSQQAGYWIKAAGVGMIIISWVGDVATASGAAESWNKDHAIDMQLDSFNGTGARLTLLAKF